MGSNSTSSPTNAPAPANGSGQHTSGAVKGGTPWLFRAALVLALLFGVASGSNSSSNATAPAPAPTVPTPAPSSNNTNTSTPAPTADAGATSSGAIKGGAPWFAAPIFAYLAAL